MQVQKYLREHGIQKLQDEFAIKVKQYDEGLIVLNYNQIDSPKSHPITMECRGLILDSDFNVVSRSMDRFFNLGEVPESQKHIDMRQAVCYEKIDGSLIRIYFWNNSWQIATRGMAFAESGPNGFDITFRGLVLKALDMNEEQFQSNCDELLDTDITYICEITSMENRCVRFYSGYTLYYLAARNNRTYEYVDASGTCDFFGMVLPKQYSFALMEDCVQATKELKNLDEGYVLYQSGIPVCKIKSPAYCAVHLLRGEGLNPKRICELVLTNEQEEYLTYFNEDRVHITPYVEILDKIHFALDKAWVDNHGIESQKDFALSIKHVKGNSVLFYARKMNCLVTEAWNAQTDAYKLKMLMETMTEFGHV
jgi:hypothetical protein